jgi:hypothetical protein
VTSIAAEQRLDPLPLPPLLYTESGAQRRVGVELEFSGLDTGTVSAAVAASFDGSVERLTDYEHVVHGHPAGDWNIELDSTLLKSLARNSDADRDTPLELLEEAAGTLLRRGAEPFVPMEVVSPPLPMDRLAEAEALIARLREAGATGTGASVTHAFGLQLNVELPALDADTIARYLKAFICLHDWLEEASGIDPTRRLTRYVASYPGDYARRVVDPDYLPDLGALADDYLAANPSRNRALDLLPLFMHLDPDRVRAAVDDPLVKPRPALHYRLPDSRIDDPAWGLHLPWAHWLEVERLAAEPARLDAITDRYCAWLDSPLTRLFLSWKEEVASWLAVRADR